MKIAAIHRSRKDSPNMADKDALILEAIAALLEAKGHTVDIFDDGEKIADGYDAIYHMSRTAETLDMLSRHENIGTIVTNPTRGVRNCSRKQFTEILDKENIKQPRYTTITDTTQPLNYPGWIKRGDGWSCTPVDVQYVTSPEETAKAITELRATGCNEIIYSQHIAGDLIKFYGVAGTDFFHWCYPDPDGGKFGLEKINGAAHKYTFNENELHATALRAARAVGIEIFGGDCVVRENGEIYIIDINDFPSFSTCRDEAAEHIAALIENKKI